MVYTTDTMNKWNDWYKNLDSTPSSFRYGDTETYSICYNWLQDCDRVEDWGCGTGGFKRFFKTESPKYIGIDGSVTPFADKHEDLELYKSSVEGICMRHVLEHNYNWKTILRNACQSFTKKMCLVLFTKFADQTTEIAHNLKHGVDVPDLSLGYQEILDIFEETNCVYELITLHTQTGYGIEHVFKLSKPNNDLHIYDKGLIA